MPTLIHSEGTASQHGETARTADMAWIDQEVQEHHQRQQFSNSNYSSEANNDTTLSGSFLEAALEELRQQRESESQQQPTPSSPWSSREKSTVVSRAALFGGHITNESSSCSSRRIDMDVSTSMIDASFQLPPPRVSAGKASKMGPNEKRYREQYSHSVSNRINSARARHPGSFRDYRNMNPAEKEVEQKRVMKLLQRLGIGSHKGPVEDNNDDNRTVDPSIALSEGATPRSGPSTMTNNKHNNGSVSIHKDMDDTLDFSDNDHDEHVEKSIALLSAGGDELSEIAVDTSITLLSPAAASTKDTSMALLSPPGSVHKTSMALLSPKPASAGKKAKESPYTAGYHSDDSTRSVEVPRADRHQYDSPATLRQERKRLASISGKRGTDQSRVRVDDHSCTGRSDLDPNASSSMMLDSPAHILRPSTSGDHRIFTASQSPISPHCTSSLPDVHDDSSSDGFVQPDISFGDDDESTEAQHSSMSSSHDYSIDQSTMSQRRVHWDSQQQRLEKPLRDTHVNVSLKSGATFHLKPLQTKHNHRSRRAPPTQSFPDPLDDYRGGLGRRLKRIYEWVHRRDGSQDASLAKGIILSLDKQQIHDVTLKLLLENPPTHESSQSQNSSKEDSTILGQTLIIAREREDLDEWSRTLREGSSFSVLNHATLPVKQRKTQSTADKCSKYDIVLSTFDAMKSSDVTLSVDEDGYVLNRKVGYEDGWYTSRSGSQSAEAHHCKQLSVLHRLTWRRIIFVDVVGRKCFLAKPGTSRATAVRAIHSQSRMMFFVGADKENAFKSLINSDKRSLLSLASVLRIDDCAEKTILRNMTIDLNHGTKQSSR